MKTKLSNITSLILFIVIGFCSCTSSGKLTKYNPEPGAIITTDGQIIYSKATGYKRPNFGTVTPPTSVGSYAITVTPRMPCVECEFAKMHLQVVYTCAAIFGLCYIGIFIHSLIKKPKNY